MCYTKKSFFDKPRLGGVVGSRRVILFCFFNSCFFRSPSQSSSPFARFIQNRECWDPELGHISSLILINAEFYRWNSKSFLQIRLIPSLLFYFWCVGLQSSSTSLHVHSPTFSNLAAFLPTFYHPLFWKWNVRILNGDKEQIHCSF